MSNTKQTNSEFLTELMEYSQSGAMMQMVIMQALVTYTDNMIADEQAFLKQMENHPMISGPGWMRAVKELHTALEKRMPSPKKASKKVDPSTN